MKKLRCIPVLLAFIFYLTAAAGMAADSGSSQAGAPQVRELQQKMLDDEGILMLIMALRDDPEMQSLLQDPAVMAAVNAGDVSVLTSDPRFIKLLDNPIVHEIQRKVDR